MTPVNGLNPPARHLLFLWGLRDANVYPSSLRVMAGLTLASLPVHHRTTMSLMKNNLESETCVWTVGGGKNAKMLGEKMQRYLEECSSPQHCCIWWSCLSAHSRPQILSRGCSWLAGISATRVSKDCSRGCAHLVEKSRKQSRNASSEQEREWGQNFEVDFIFQLLLCFVLFPAEHLL